MERCGVEAWSGEAHWNGGVNECVEVMEWSYGVVLCGEARRLVFNFYVIRDENHQTLAF